MDKLSVKEARCESAIGKTAKLQGWVRTRRDSKAGFSFIEIRSYVLIKGLVCCVHLSLSPEDEPCHASNDALLNPEKVAVCIHCPVA